VQLFQKLLHLQHLQGTTASFPPHLRGWQQRKPLLGWPARPVHYSSRQMSTVSMNFQHCPRAWIRDARKKKDPTLQILSRPFLGNCGRPKER
jgi:hypothetical protein